MDPKALPTENAQQDLVVQWIPFAISLARRHFRSDTRFDLEERKSTAYEALCKAAIKYDPLKINPNSGKPYSFGSYAGMVIWDHLHKTAHKNGSLMTRPSVGNKDAPPELAQQALSEYAEQENGYTPDFSDVEYKELLAKLNSILSKPEQCVLRGLLAHKKYKAILKDLQKHKAFADQTNVSIVSKFRKSIMYKMQENGWGFILGDQETFNDVEYAEEPKPKSAQKQRLVRTAALQKSLFSVAPYLSEGAHHVPTKSERKERTESEYDDRFLFSV